MNPPSQCIGTPPPPPSPQPLSNLCFYIASYYVRALDERKRCMPTKLWRGEQNTKIFHEDLISCYNLI